MNSQRRRFIFALITSLILLTIGIYFAFIHTTPPDAEEAAQFIQGVLVNNSYRYALDAVVTTESGQTREYFNLDGMVSYGDAYVVGTVLGTPVQLMYVDGQFYQMGADNVWRQVTGEGMGSVAQLFAELDPAAAFSYSGFEGFEYVGIVESEDGMVQRVIVIPEQTGWVAEYFTDVVYTLDLDRRGTQLLSIQLDATLREDPSTTISILATFYDVGEDIEINAPV